MSDKIHLTKSSFIYNPFQSKLNFILQYTFSPKHPPIKFLLTGNNNEEHPSSELTRKDLLTNAKREVIV